jgi:putative chitinase
MPALNPVRRPVSAPSISALSVLKEGANGPQVADLQRKLAAAGFSPGAADGAFGPKTKAAVVAFQRARGLVADGIVGPKTWAALNAAPPSAPGGTVLKEGARGASVVDLQKKLAAHGFSPGAADGVFGPRTESAVKSFQRAKGLVADGIVGPKTWGALNSTPSTPRPPPTGPTGPTGPVGPVTPGNGNFASGVVALAQAELNKGVAENPPGSNRQPYSAFWNRPPEPWCADFVSYICRQNGNKDINFASVDMLLGHLKKTGQFHANNPAAGDIIIFDWNRNDNDPSEHTGIVESVFQRDGKTWVQTIEGNSSNKVARRQYPVNDQSIVGYGTVKGTGGVPGTPPPSGGVGRPTLRQGASGPDVMDLQKRLNELGFGVGTADGDFGPKTLAGVKAFQKAKGLEADGIVGPKTWSALGITASRPVEPGTPTGEGVSVQQLRAIMPNLSASRANELMPHLNKAMAEAGINTPRRQAAFLAQLAHESGEFRYFEEIADGSRYEGRKDLGNTQPGDGRRFKGRGPIQLTGRSNYTNAGKALGLDLVGNPAQVATPEVGFRTTAWYWNSRNLNSYADAGDFDAITKRINGGYNGKADRDRYYARALNVLSR